MNGAVIMDDFIEPSIDYQAKLYIDRLAWIYDEFYEDLTEDEQSAEVQRLALLITDSHVKNIKSREYIKLQDTKESFVIDDVKYANKLGNVRPII